MDVKECVLKVFFLVKRKDINMEILNGIIFKVLLYVWDYVKIIYFLYDYFDDF